MMFRISVLSGFLLVGLSAPCLSEISPVTRTLIDRITRGKGLYASDEDAYRVVFPRTEAAIVQDYQTLSPSLGLNSWGTFSPAVHQPAMLSAQFLLLADEVNPAVDGVLDEGLEVMALAPSCVFESPCLYTLSASGRGTFQNLATSFRKVLDEIARTRRSIASVHPKISRPTIPIESAIDGGPLDTILSMRGTVIGGAYRGAIGKRSVIHGELIGREMGISTWISFAGTNDRALVHGELVEIAEDLQKVLKAARAKGINVASIRNHTVGEHPQYLYIRFWAQGNAIELAKAIRYVLDVDFGALPPPGEKM